ncbi:FAD-binding protein [bacterium]|nr:MAG: FAD-binding protein [bacterium]
MSAHTTLGIGGKADLFYTTENSGDLVKAVRLCRTFKVPVTVIGEGGGVVVSDSGIRGMVIKNKSERIQIKPQRNIIDFFRKKEVKKVEVVIDSGVDVDVAVDKLMSLGIVGLEKYASLSGSVGAVVSNGEGRNFLKRVSVLDVHGGVRSMGADKEPGGSIVIDATYLLSYGETKTLGKKIATERKKRQKMFSKSAGKVFEDIAVDEQMALGYPTRNAGYIVGEVLNMRGFRSGKMAISDLDQNVVVNLGGGKATDFIAVVEEIKRRAREAIGIELEEKVVRLGFEVE